MANESVAKNVRFEEIEQILKLAALIISELGYRKDGREEPSQKRQVIFTNQILISDSAFSLTVVLLSTGEKTFNFDFRCLPGQKSPVILQDREVKSVVIQVVESGKFKQITIQICFTIPLNYRSVDLIFRVKVEDIKDGRKIKIGYPWFDPEQHISPEAAWDLITQIYTALTQT